MANGPRYRVSVPDVEFFKELIPCQAACPVHTDAGRYVQLIAQGNNEQAYLTACSPNPFASVCGRVCAAPCEDHCRRGVIDKPVSIRALKGYVCELYGPESSSPIARQLLAGGATDPGNKVAWHLPMLAESRKQVGEGKKIAVIGAGPAGLSCAHDLVGITTVFSFAKLQQAIAAKNFTGNEDGIPVVSYDAVKEAEVNVGLGPLHTQFDDKGYAYTSLYVESAIAKWKLGTWEVVDKIPVSYNIGHLAIPGGDTVHPDGKYVLALNKLSHGRHLSVGPAQPEDTQLIDISGDKMKLLYDAFTEPEPHYAEMIPADRLHPIEVYAQAENHDPNAVWDVQHTGIKREGNHVVVHMTAVRSNFEPNKIEVNQGDLVTIYLTNIEQTTNEIHGWALEEYNIQIAADPGETKTIEFVADKPGVFAYYCTKFCSALHQEMQGYLLVKPKGGAGTKAALTHGSHEQLASAGSR
jgi:heme/copper-type cytochrome/quinol oxidase subunit 2